MPTTTHWPLFGLRLTAPGLELRLPGLDELAALADLAADGVHDPAVQPFAVAWTDTSPPLRARATLQHHWRTWGAWTPEDWSLELVAVVDGQVVGTQAVSAKRFATARTVGTGSWVGQAWQGRGFGTRMRAAVLHLAFDGLGARVATSAAFADNPASLRVSAKLGYRDNGTDVHVVRDRPVTVRRLLLDRARWAATRTEPVEIHGLAPCLPLFGVEPA